MTNTTAHPSSAQASCVSAMVSCWLTGSRRLVGEACAQLQPGRGAVGCGRRPCQPGLGSLEGQT